MAESPEFLINEGICPVHGVEIELFEVGGTEKFFEQHHYQPREDLDTRTWKENPASATIGCMRFRCGYGQGHELEIYATRTGDWQAAF